MASTQWSPTSNSPLLSATIAPWKRSSDCGSSLALTWEVREHTEPQDSLDVPQGQEQIQEGKIYPEPLGSDSYCFCRKKYVFEAECSDFHPRSGKEG